MPDSGRTQALVSRRLVPPIKFQVVSNRCGGAGVNVLKPRDDRSELRAAFALTHKFRQTLSSGSRLPSSSADYSGASGKENACLHELGLECYRQLRREGFRKMIRSVRRMFRRQFEPSRRTHIFSTAAVHQPDWCRCCTCDYDSRVQRPRESCLAGKWIDPAW